MTKEKQPTDLLDQSTTNPSNPLRKIRFGAISKKKESGKADVPVIPDPNGQLAVLAARIIERHSQVESLGGELDLDKAELKTLITPFYFRHCSGKIDIPSSIAVRSPGGHVTVVFQNRYAKLESEEPLVPVLGANANKYFRQAFTLEIDGDKLPSERVQGLIDELQELFSKHDATEALKVRDSIKSVPEFHTIRHTVLRPEQNLALDQVCPIISMVKPQAGKPC
jgi:hypothetical protein